MSKGLEALKWSVDNDLIKYENGWQEAPYILESINEIENELKEGEKNKQVVEIIKGLVNSFDDLPCGKYVQEQVIEILKSYLKEHLKQKEQKLLEEVLL